MSDFFQWISGGSIPSIIFICICATAIVGITLIYFIAFLQGREISFWPPKIGERPNYAKPKDKNVAKNNDVLPDAIVENSLKDIDLVSSQKDFFQSLFGKSVKFFLNSDMAYPDIVSEAIKSSNIKYMGSHNTTFLREKTLQDTLLYRLLNESKIRNEKLPSIKFLHLSPTSKFVLIRSQEINYSPDGHEIRIGLENCLKDIRLIEKKCDLPEGSVEVKHFDFSLIFRLVILDRCAYIGIYKLGTVGRDTPVIKISKDSDFYAAFVKFFQTIWENFSDITPNSDYSQNKQE